MGKYENGISTRKCILAASRRLFLEKGFHETSSEDICQAAHVNRSAIHYHFKDKENLRYEVLWEIFMEYRDLASAYCAAPEFQMLCAIYLSWCHAVKSPQILRFQLDYSRDYPVYIPNKPLPAYYRLLYQYIFDKIWPLKNISHLDFSAIYGHLMAQMQLLASQPGRYTGKELFFHGMKACLHVWGFPREKAETFWREMAEAIDSLPEDLPERLTP